MDWATLRAFSNELEKVSNTDPMMMASLIPGALAGYGTGKSIAGHAGAITAPHGSKTRSEEIAKRVAQVTGPIGMVGGLALAKKHNLGGKLSTFIGRRWPHGLVADRETEKRILHAIAPAAAMVAGGAAGGAATGVTTGGIARIKHHLTKKKEPKNKTAEVRKKTTQDRIDKAVEEGVPILGGLSVGRTLSDLSFAKQHGASPRRKTIGALIGAAAGFGYNKHKADKKARKKAAKMVKTSAPFQFNGTATKRFLSKPGKTIKDLSPKIGRMGVMPV